MKHKKTKSYYLLTYLAKRTEEALDKQAWLSMVHGIWVYNSSFQKGPYTHIFAWNSYYDLKCFNFKDE